MSSNANMALADCEQQARKLVEEIAKFRAAGAISDQTAKSLEQLCAALNVTQKNIRPFTETFTRRILIALGSVLLVNLALLISILVLQLWRL